MDEEGNLPNPSFLSDKSLPVPHSKDVTLPVFILALLLAALLFGACCLCCYCCINNEDVPWARTAQPLPQQPQIPPRYAESVPTCCRPQPDLEQVFERQANQPTQDIGTENSENVQEKLTTNCDHINTSNLKPALQSRLCYFFNENPTPTVEYHNPVLTPIEESSPGNNSLSSETEVPPELPTSSPTSDIVTVPTFWNPLIVNIPPFETSSGTHESEEVPNLEPLPQMCYHQHCQAEPDCSTRPIPTTCPMFSCYNQMRSHMFSDIRCYGNGENLQNLADAQFGEAFNSERFQNFSDARMHQDSHMNHCLNDDTWSLYLHLLFPDQGFHLTPSTTDISQEAERDGHFSTAQCSQAINASQSSEDRGSATRTGSFDIASPPTSSALLGGQSLFSFGPSRLLFHRSYSIPPNNINASDSPTHSGAPSRICSRCNLIKLLCECSSSDESENPEH